MILFQSTKNSIHDDIWFFSYDLTYPSRFDVGWYGIYEYFSYNLNRYNYISYLIEDEE